VEKAAADAGTAIKVPFTPGRVDTTQDLTDVETFAYRKSLAHITFDYPLKILGRG
jgi:catalase-peroxidase